jgi:hypothetical protein
VYQEIQILRFLGNTAAVGRHEGTLKFITDRGNVSRAEIEVCYRQNIGAHVATVVDEEAANAQPTNQASIKEIKQIVTNFFLSPTNANFDVLNRKQQQYAITDGDRGINASGVLNYTINTFSTPLADAVLNPSLLVTEHQ